MKKYLLLGPCLIALGLIASPVFAQTVEQDGARDPYSLKTERAERIFLKYHQAIHAAESCRDQDVTPADRLAMDRIIAARMAVNVPDVVVGAARLLTLTRQADDTMDHIISREGCDGATVKKALQLFDEKLSPAMNTPSPANEPAMQAQEETPPTEVAPTSLAP